MPTTSRSRKKGRQKLPHQSRQEPEPHPSEQTAVVLYVAGTTGKLDESIAALRHLTNSGVLKGKYHIEVVDIFKNPEAAASAPMLAVSTTATLLPGPLRILIGQLFDEEKVLVGLVVRPSTIADAQVKHRRNKLEDAE